MASPAKPLHAAILATGNELLTGVTLNTHAHTLSQWLTERGLWVGCHLTVGDDMGQLLWALGELAKNSQLVFVVGGLGPTVDDLTQPALARFCGQPLVRDEACAAHLQTLYASRGMTLHQNNLKQADFPQGSEILPNPYGTAAGFALLHEGTRFVCLPGVPREFHPMLSDQVAPRLGEWFPQLNPVARVVLRTFGATEAGLDRRLKEIGDFPPTVTVGFRHQFPENDVVLLASPQHQPDLAHAATLVQQHLGPLVYSDGPGIAQTLVALLHQHNLTLGVVESCTGGLLGATLTTAPGASDVFDGGALTYANEAKTGLVGVPPQVIAAHGAVSEETALAMARGLRALRTSQEMSPQRYATLAITGVAGPGGGTPEKPVGTVWVALCGPWGEVARRYQFKGDREQNRQLAVRSALELLRRQMLGLPLDIRERP